MNEAKKKFTICLIGSIPKGDSERKSWIDWKEKYKKALGVLGEVDFTDGDVWRDETRPMELVGHDAYLVQSSDLVVVNAESKLGAGTAQEMVIAKYYERPLIAVLPKDTHHRRSNVEFDGTKIDDWMHPFLVVVSDLIVEKLDEAIPWIRELREDSSAKQIKDIKIIDQAIQKFKEFDNQRG